MTTIEHSFAAPTLIENDVLPPRTQSVGHERDDDQEFPPNVVPSENIYYSSKSIESVAPTDRILMQIGVEQRELELQLQFRVRNHLLERMVLAQDKDAEVDLAVLSMDVIIPEYETQRQRHEHEALRIKTEVIPAAHAHGNAPAQGFHDYTQKDIPTLAASAESHYYMTHYLNGLLDSRDETAHSRQLIERAQSLADAALPRAREMYAEVMAAKESFVKRQIAEKRVEIKVLENHRDSLGSEEIEVAQNEELALRVQLGALQEENRALREENALLKIEKEIRDFADWQNEVDAFAVTALSKRVS